ncbi:Asp-tRNA(Asn)/Glu-tRNA(Gln) amidotransferase subunit GatC [Marinomonas sp. 15G1-11]|uniref:Aspartyl/glutamyl-tRNA(Asn/Gln) amidotransferase subunit C n=1 Tax=Marinomonas phaeophyticola TaxID=3004091 RepID=A0ABT4JX86_9GAMM|nr:Asp-tRNA(Asn)/Glu-tRNA(Gln) amidotransferase subunit GatC [Marinomonas sp. 15G1-11]MCZ2723021.1 Asp-tRNA(Asn)/Glu-tRNA(Gln) amidotransferase subunit GatC [Marinomonas sp. 15G1-11]
MSLNKQDVQKIAHLARLSLSDNESEQYQESISSVLTLVEQMQSVNTDGVEPLCNPLEMTQRLREDAVTESNQRDSYLAIAPQSENGLYLVPQVID